MSISLQKANFWKRISAYILDFILTVILTTGAALAVSEIVKYDACLASYQARQEVFYHKIEEEHEINLNLSEEEYNALSQEERAEYAAKRDVALEELNELLQSDQEFVALHSKIFTLILLITSISLLLGIVGAYFLVPLFLKNGQTLGKKVFGLGVMRSNCVKISNPILFIRSIVGLYAMETMFPIYLFIMILFKMLDIVGIIVIALFFILQIGVMIYTQTNSSIHDLLSDTVVVDFASQHIFDSQEELIAYKQAKHEEEVKNQN